MKVTGLETIQLAEFSNVLWVRVHTDQGLIGLGETFFGANAVAVGSQNPIVVFGSPFLERLGRIGDIHQIEITGQNQLFRQNVSPATLRAIIGEPGRHVNGGPCRSQNLGEDCACQLGESRSPRKPANGR